MATTTIRGDRYVEQDEETDRLSNLSDDILQHLLSFLDDTKFTVQTSLLSRRWRHLWKDVPALHFRRNSFHTGDQFQTFQRNVLSLRSGRTGHRDQVLRVLSFRQCYGETDEIYGMVASVTTRHESLATLQFFWCAWIDLGGIAACRFGAALTTLELRGCSLVFRDGDDPFADLPLLECLKIISCVSTSRAVKVSGLRLLSLQIDNADGFGIGELLAPRLESFYFSSCVNRLLELRPLNLPSLGRASVLLRLMCGLSDEQTRAVMSLLRGLCNAKSLHLCFEDMFRRSEISSLINMIKPMIDEQLSQFTRLETSRIRCS
ncbi:unnamed protein product [Linum trigynum]|uniref:F-box domain-containing protein n=1 Tax=Linum trigynum TaxID=586398 RepID=A0AAV2EIU1_9ROSI